MLVSDLFSRADDLLQDTGGTRWPEAERIHWLNDGQRAVVILRPDANAINAQIALNTADTKQTLPAGGIRWMDVRRNMGALGGVAGSPIKVIDRETLDAIQPTWHQALGTEIKYFVFDPRDPKTIYVTPLPKNGGTNVHYVEALYVALPTDCIAPSVQSTATISLDPIYSNALLEYLLYRSYLKDAEYGGIGGRAALHYQAFVTELGLKSKVDVEIQPEVYTDRMKQSVPKTGAI